MCKASQLTAEINFDSIPFIDGVDSLAKSDNISTGTKRNLDHATDFTHFDKKISTEQKLMVADAQTSGGLLVALPEKEAHGFVKKCMEETGLSSKQIGFLSTKKENRIIIK
jgi:selenide,water dikinase